MVRSSLRITLAALLITIFTSHGKAEEKLESWRTVQVPAVWKRGGKQTRGGYAWYRCQVKVPDDWNGRKLNLFFEPVDDARALFINGTTVAKLGSFPPTYRSGIGLEDRFELATDAVEYGKLNTFAIRVYEKDARENFNVAAPVLFAGEGAIRLEGEWEWRAGDDVSWRSEECTEATPRYEKVMKASEAEQTLKRIPGDEGPLSPIDSLAKASLPAPWKAEIALADPDIGQPLSFKFDHRGRMWVIEYLQYPHPAGLTAVSRDKYLRTVYDSLPKPPPHHHPGADKISIHEDTNGDGKYDKHKTFVSGLSLASSFAFDQSGLWVLNPPHLLYYPDRNHDDQPDGDPIVHLEGFGIEDSHSIANSLRWGPDGWLYAAQGSTVTGNIRRPGEKEVTHSMGQLIWRYHPETKKYEVFAEGGGNTFGVEIDSKGRIFSGHNGGDTRGFHYVQGGYSRKGFGKHGELSNPYAFGYFPQMTHANVPRFTHTFVIYEGGNWGEDYSRRMFAIAPLQGEVIESEVLLEGSTFQTKDVARTFITKDSWFRPVDIQPGPDGALYVADFYEQRIDHASHYQGRVHRESGRILRISRGGETASPFPAKAALAKTIGALESRNRWTRQTALRLIGQSNDQTVVPQLLTTAREGEAQQALEAVWALHQLGALDETLAAEFIAHSDPYIRLWSVRLQCDDYEVSTELAKQLAAMARSEPNVEVRSQLACSARRLPADQALPIVAGLITHAADSEDLHLPLLLWWAIERHADRGAEEMLPLLGGPEFWKANLSQRHLIGRWMKRYAMSGKRQDLVHCATLLASAPSDELRKHLMASFEEAYGGRSLTNIPPELAQALTKSGGGSLTLRMRTGDTEAIADGLKALANTKTPHAIRLQHLQILSELTVPAARELLLTIVERREDATLHAAALTGLQRYQGDDIGKRVIAQLPKLATSNKDAAFSLLVSRKEWAASMLAAVKEQQVPADSLPENSLRRVLLHDDAKLTALAKQLFPTLTTGGKDSAEYSAKIKEISLVLEGAAGNPYEGKKQFRQHCGKCHQLFDDGGEIGPDLTAYQRNDLARVLANVLNPSLEIREGFETYSILTEDGRQLSGFIADQDKQVVMLRGVDGQTIVVPRHEIEVIKAQPTSLMPEKLLADLSEQEIRDLFAYLRSTQPLP